MNKKLLVAAVSSALAAPMAAQAVKYKLSGQVNRAVVYLSDGEGSDFQSVDNGASNTRIRVRGSEDLGNGMTAGINWEWSNTANPAGQALKVGQQDKDGEENLRHADIWFSGAWGQLSIGKGSSASDNATGSNHSTVFNAGVSAARGTFGGGAAWRFDGASILRGVALPAGFSANDDGSDLQAFEASTLDGVQVLVETRGDDGEITEERMPPDATAIPAGENRGRLTGRLGRLTGNRGTLTETFSTVTSNTGLTRLGEGNDTLTVSDTHSSLDSGRENRIRYDTPAIGPLTLKASLAQDGFWDIAAVVDTAVMGGEFEAQGFYASEKDGGDNRYGGSFSYKFAQGTNFAFTYARKDMADDDEVDPDTIYFFLGHDLGNTEVGIGYGISRDFAPTKGRGTVTHVNNRQLVNAAGVATPLAVEIVGDTSIFQIGVNHNFPKANMDVYAGYHLHSLDLDVNNSNVDVNDIHVVAVGAKVKFD